VGSGVRDVPQPGAAPFLFWLPAHGVMEERVDCKILSWGSGRRSNPADTTARERVTDSWLLTLISVIVISLLSLGLWSVVWTLTSP
jgi:hypothetical protein